jgi:hypothetical protein
MSLNSPTGRFVRHLLEMVVAMVVGMVALGPLWRLALGALGASDVLTVTEVSALVMATNMTIGMSVWMLVRGHRLPAIAEMGAAMFVPFLVLFPPLWLGVLSGGDVMMLGHVLMVPAMVLAMLWRRDEYTGHHQHQQQGAPRERLLEP